jgi:hypothetical protein
VSCLCHSVPLLVVSGARPPGDVALRFPLSMIHRNLQHPGHHCVHTGREIGPAARPQYPPSML